MALIENNRKRTGDDGNHRTPRALFAFSPASPQHKEASGEERMQLRERIILNSEMADLNSNFNSAVEASVLELDRLGMSRVIRNEKVKAISTLASGQDLLALLKPTPPTQLFMPKCFLFQTVLFFFLASRLCFGGFYVLTEQM